MERKYLNENSLLSEVSIEVNSNKKQLIDNTLWMYLGKITSQILGFVASVLVIRKLPVDLYGTYMFVFGLFFIYQLIITSPVKHLLLRYIPELRSKNDYLSLKQLMLTTVFGVLLMVLIFTALLIAFNQHVMLFFNLPQFHLYINAFIVFVISYSLANYSESLLSAYLLHKWIAIIKVIAVGVRSVSYFVLHKHLNVSLLLYIEALVSVLSLFLALIAIYLKALPELKRFKETIQSNAIVKKRMWRFWSLSLFSEFGYGIIGRTSDQYIIAAMSNPYNVGLYAFSLKVFEIIYKILPLREFESILKPIFFGKFSSESPYVDLNNYYLFIIKILLPVLLFPLVFFVVFGQGFIIHVFGVKYIDAYGLILVALLSICLNAYFYPLSMLIQLKERIEIILYTRFVAIFSIGTGVFLMAKIGIIGVAWATLFGELLKNVMMLWLFKKHMILKYEYSMFYRYILVFVFSILIFAPFYYVRQELAFVILGGVLISFVYLVALINVHPFRKEELQWLESVFLNSKQLAWMLPYLKVLIQKVKFN